MQQLKTYSLFLGAFAFLPCMLYAQQAPSIQWQHCFGGSGGEGASSIIHANDSIEDHYVIAGGTSSAPKDGDVYDRKGGMSDAWILCVDKTKILWQTCIGGSSDYELAQCIIPTRDGGYAVCGATSSSDGDFFDYHDSIDAWVAKLNSQGRIEWVRCYGGNSYDGATSIVETEEGFVFSGFTNSKSGDVSSCHYDAYYHNPPYIRKSDAWVVSLNTEGDILWQRCYGGSGDDFQNFGGNNTYSIIRTNDGGFAFATGSSSNDGDVTGDHLDSAVHPTYDCWVVKVSRIGNIQWEKCFGGSSFETPRSIIQTSDGGYAIAGATYSNDGDIRGKHPPNLNGSVSNEWVIKLNSSGILQWQKCLGGSGSSTSGDEANSIIQISGGDYIIAGSARSNDGDISGNHWDSIYHNSDTWIVRLSSDGKDIKWQKCYGGVGGESVASIIRTSDGGYIFTGYTDANTDSVDGDVSGFHPGSGDIWVVKLEPDTIFSSVNYSNDFISNNVKIYPNPSATEAHFSLNANYSLLTAGFYDIMGRQYFPNYTLENNLINCDVHDLPSGIYLARLPWTSLMAWQDGKYAGSFTVPFLVQH
jgi:hypothetical protein